MRLKGEICRVSQLSGHSRQRMFELMALHYDDVAQNRFEDDLQEKEWVILLQDRLSGHVQGFSTQMILENLVEGTPVKAVFSGDTIINKEYWGEAELARVWLDFFVSLAHELRGIKLYWFLAAMGYKTYRFLPLYFHEFYPRFNTSTPAFEKKVIDAFGYQKYPLEYDRKTGVIHHADIKERLKPGIADVDRRRLGNPHIKYFIHRNPLHMQGDELACIAEVTSDNLTRAALKVMSKGESCGIRVNQGK